MYDYGIMSEGLSDQRVALIVFGVFLLLASFVCLSFPWVSAWVRARNAKIVEYRFWAPWLAPAETRLVIQT